MAESYPDYLYINVFAYYVYKLSITGKLALYQFSISITHPRVGFAVFYSFFGSHMDTFGNVIILVTHYTRKCTVYKK